MVWLWPAGFCTDPVRWHLRELLFGMGGAAVGGYLLTALPSWTGTGPVAPSVVRRLTLLWLLARLALPAGQTLPFAVGLILALGYFLGLALVLAQHLIAARIWSRLGFVAIPVSLAAGDGLFQTDLRGLYPAAQLPLAMTLLFAVLIGVIGGRAVPAFSRSWLQQIGARRPVRHARWLAILANAATALGGLLVVVGHGAAGFWLVCAGVLQVARLMGWQTVATRRYPALLILHLAWVWVPLGLGLLGLATLRPDVIALTAALHALTMGAMGTMILAIAGRAAMPRRGGRLIAGRGLLLGFALVWLAALLRSFAAFVPASWPDPISGSAAIWMLGWGLFLWAYRPALRGALPRPILSAQRQGQQQS